MSTREILWPVGGAAMVLGVVAVIFGQVLTSVEMDVVDEAGPGGPSGTLLSPAGIATIGGAICFVGGLVVLTVAAAVAGRQKQVVPRSLGS